MQHFGLRAQKSEGQREGGGTAGNGSGSGGGAAACGSAASGVGAGIGGARNGGASSGEANAISRQITDLIVRKFSEEATSLEALMRDAASYKDAELEGAHGLLV